MRLLLMVCVVVALGCERPTAIKPTQPSETQPSVAPILKFVDSGVVLGHRHDAPRTLPAVPGYVVVDSDDPQPYYLVIVIHPGGMGWNYEVSHENYDSIPDGIEVNIFRDSHGNKVVIPAGRN